MRGKERPIERGIVPTPVGVNRTHRSQKRGRADCPHARGGEPIALFVAVKRLQLSPRPWG